MKLTDEQFDSMCDRVEDLVGMVQDIGKQHGLGPRKMVLATTLALVAMLDVYEIPRDKVIELLRDLTPYEEPGK